MKSWKIRKSELYKKRGQVFQVEETVIKKAIRQATLVTFQGLLEDQCGLRTVGEKENHSENWERWSGFLNAFMHHLSEQHGAVTDDAFAIGILMMLRTT